MQNNNANGFVKFITRNRPYKFNTDIENIKETLVSESKLSQTDTEEDVLNFMLNNLGYEFQIKEFNMKVTCSDCFQRWLNHIESRNEDVPDIGFDTTDILIAILAFTGTGISWIIWSLCDPYYQQIFRFVIGVINILISGLFVCSILFGWVLAVQIMLGILFALLAIFTVVMTIFNAYNNRDLRRKNDKSGREFMQEHIKNMREYLEQVKQTSKQSKNDKSDKSNDKIKDEADNQNNNFPDSEKIIDKDKKGEQQ